MKLSVATNFKPDFLDAMAGYPVTELFGKLSSDSMGGGRASFMLSPLTVGQLREHIRAAAERGIGFNYLINPACLDNREYTRQGQADLERLLELVEECGATAVTVSLPFLIAIIKKRHPQLKVRVGVYARVDSVAKAKFWEGLGADCITLESITVNRDFAMLKAIRSAVSLELQLIANSNCLMFCPLSGQHMVNLAHASQKGHASGGFMIDYCALRCSAEKLTDPSNYLRSEFIRPEDIDTYLKMGFTSFKILERGAPTAVMAQRVRAYSERSFDGNLLDLIQPYGYKGTSAVRAGWPEKLRMFLKYFFRPGRVNISELLKLKKLAEKRGLLAAMESDPVYIDNRKLDGFLAGLQAIDCRTTDCSSCGYCAAWTEKSVSMDMNFQSRMLALYADAFGSLYSGRFWGIEARSPKNR